MENTLELVTKFGLGTALALVLAYLFGLVIKWLLGEFSKKIDDLHAIVVKLIDKSVRLDDDIGGMAGKLNYQRREQKDES
jgi:predicted membrane protein